MEHTTLKVLSSSEWHQRRDAHIRRATSLTEAHLDRAARSQRHPVWDFLFSYYPVTPGKLKHWSPGGGVALEGDCDGGDMFGDKYFEEINPAAVHTTEQQGFTGVSFSTSCGTTSANVSSSSAASVASAALSASSASSRPHSHDHRNFALNEKALWDKRGTTFDYIENLLASTMRNPSQFDCFGLHEWAMVYHDKPRHPEPLRLGKAGSDEVVDAHELKCTHYDAFRFFTPTARPLNRTTPTRPTQPQCEQAGCLHAGMDIYKWATKLGPLVPGEVLLDAFELARDIRELDMRASPYDLTAWGFSPIKIETAEGKSQYVSMQRDFTARGNRLREEILSIIRESRARIVT